MFNTNQTVLSANGDTKPLTLDQVKKVTVFVEGNLGAGSIQLKTSQDGSAFHNFGSPISALGVSIIELPAGITKGTLAGATAPSVTVTFLR